jgi:hypothetical protein
MPQSYNQTTWLCEEIVVRVNGGGTPWLGLLKGVNE